MASSLPQTHSHGTGKKPHSEAEKLTNNPFRTFSLDLDVDILASADYLTAILVTFPVQGFYFGLKFLYSHYFFISHTQNAEACVYIHPNNMVLIWLIRLK